MPTKCAVYSKKYTNIMSHAKFFRSENLMNIYKHFEQKKKIEIGNTGGCWVCVCVFPLRLHTRRVCFKFGFLRGSAGFWTFRVPTPPPSNPRSPLHCAWNRQSQELYICLYIYQTQIYIYIYIYWEWKVGVCVCVFAPKYCISSIPIRFFDVCYVHILLSLRL